MYRSISILCILIINQEMIKENYGSFKGYYKDIENIGDYEFKIRVDIDDLKMNKYVVKIKEIKKHCKI